MGQFIERGGHWPLFLKKFPFCNCDFALAVYRFGQALIRADAFPFAMALHVVIDLVDALLFEDSHDRFPPDESLYPMVTRQGTISLVPLSLSARQSPADDANSQTAVAAPLERAGCCGLIETDTSKSVIR